MKPGLALRLAARPAGLRRARTRRRLRLSTVTLMSLAVSPAAGQPAGDMSIEAARDSAATLAAFGRETGDPAILAAALGLLVASGARIEAGDPWGADLLFAEARSAAGPDAALRAALDAMKVDRRGFLESTNRREIRLAPGESETIRLTAVAGEPAFVEAAVKRDSQGADIDLSVRGPDGGVLAQDIAPDTGVLGNRAFAEWLPEACAEVEVLLVNRGAGSAAFVFIAPPTRQTTCHE